MPQDAPAERLPDGTLESVRQRLPDPKVLVGRYQDEITKILVFALKTIEEIGDGRYKLVDRKPLEGLTPGGEYSSNPWHLAVSFHPSEGLLFVYYQLGSKSRGSGPPEITNYVVVNGNTGRVVHHGKAPYDARAEQHRRQRPIKSLVASNRRVDHWDVRKSLRRF